MTGSPPRREDPTSPDSACDSALRHLVAAVAAYARAVRAAGRAVGLPTTRFFVYAHDGADVAVMRDDVVVALCPACAALFAAGALRFAELGQVFCPAGG